MSNYINALGQDVILYRKELVELAGGILPSLLLSQIIYRANKKGGKFYKFITPPEKEHNAYFEGDSWCEELGITKKQFGHSIKKFGFKKGKTKNEIEEKDAIIVYYTDADHVTWWEVNTELLNYLLDNIYNKEDEEKENSPKKEIKKKKEVKEDDSHAEEQVTKFLKAQQKNMPSMLIHYKKDPEKYKENQIKAYNKIRKELQETYQNPYGIDAIINYITTNDFWKNKCGSIEKLRKKDKETGIKNYCKFLDKINRKYTQPYEEPKEIPKEMQMKDGRLEYEDDYTFDPFNPYQ